MSLIVSSILIILTILINCRFLHLTKNYKEYTNLIKLRDRKEEIKLLNKFWKKQISIIAIGVMLIFLLFFVDSNNKVVFNTFSVIVILYVIICNFFGVYSYKILKKNYKYIENS